MCKILVQKFIIKDILKKKNAVHWISVRTIVSYCYNIKDKICLKISDSYLLENISYGYVKNGMLYSDNAKIINTINFLYDPL